MVPDRKSQSITANERREIESDEYSPLLRGQNDREIKGYGGVPVRNDEERGENLPDKQPRTETPPNVVGIISVLLLGMLHEFFRT